MHGIYTLLLIACYRDSDFNQVYPVARGMAPPTVAICAALFVGERISGVQAIGLGVLTAGMLTIAAGRGPGSRRSFAAAALTGLTIAAYTVLDGVGVRHSGSALGYTGWLFVAEGADRADRVVGAARRVTRRGGAASRRPCGAAPRWPAVLSVLAYGLVLYAQTQGALAVVAALRETSVVWGAVIGAAMFREQLPSRRVVAAALIAGGAVILAAG